jgi:hypothetical protein
MFFVNRYFYPDESATAQLLADLAFGLAAAGAEVHVICCRQRYTDEAASLPGRETIRGVSVHRLWTTRFGRDRLLGRAVDYASFYLTCAGFLLLRLRRGDLVVAKTDPPLISVIAAFAARWRRAVLVNWLQDVFPEVASALGANPLPAPLDRLLRRLRNASLRQAAVNVVLGERMRDYVVAQGVAAGQIEVIENWADTAEMRVLSPAHSALRAHQGLQDRFVVGYSGNLGRAHEYQTLLGAAMLLSHDPGIVSRRAGAGAREHPIPSLPAARRAWRQFGGRRCAPRQSAAGPRGTDRAEQILRHPGCRPTGSIHRRSRWGNRPCRAGAALWLDRRAGRQRRSGRGDSSSAIGIE